MADVDQAFLADTHIKRDLDGGLHTDGHSASPRAFDSNAASTPENMSAGNVSPSPANRSKHREELDKEAAAAAANKRRCVSTACIACRKRKSKCDGNTPSCAACSSVYGTECIYDPSSDHRRKGVYKRDIDSLKTRNSTLQTLIQAILNLPEEDVPDLVKQIRTCESLDAVAESILAKEQGIKFEDDVPLDGVVTKNETVPLHVPQFEKELSGRLGKVRLDNGAFRVIGGTSNLIWIGEGDQESQETDEVPSIMPEEPVTSWTEVTKDPQLVSHLLNMYFTWHYPYFTTMSRTLFWKDFRRGHQLGRPITRTEYCTPLLVNAMLALGCHFSTWPGTRASPHDSLTAGDHFFSEAKRLIHLNDEHENPRLATVQALALMSVREAGCGREASGWIYSGMSFRMACDLGLNIGTGDAGMDEADVDARRMSMWGCFLFDKCWSNYLGRQPQLPLTIITVPKFDVFPNEDAETWRPYLDSGVGQANAQASKTRAVARQISSLCEISGDLLQYFYHPQQLEHPLGKQAEIKKLSELHTRLEAWRLNLPKDLDSKEGQLPHVLVMHMFFQLLFIHLFRPFLKYKKGQSPLPAHVSPRKMLLHSAANISKLLRLYRRTYGLRQICNIVVYMAHTACTIHLLNLPDKNAYRDIQHGLNHLEEMAEGWPCARRTLGILQLVARRWEVDLPEGAAKTFARAESKFGNFPASPRPRSSASPSVAEHLTVDQHSLDTYIPQAAQRAAAMSHAQVATQHDAHENLYDDFTGQHLLASSIGQIDAFDPNLAAAGVPSAGMPASTMLNARQAPSPIDVGHHQQQQQQHAMAHNLRDASSVSSDHHTVSMQQQFSNAAYALHQPQQQSSPVDRQAEAWQQQQQQQQHGAPTDTPPHTSTAQHQLMTAHPPANTTTTNTRTSNHLNSPVAPSPVAPAYHYNTNQHHQALFGGVSGLVQDQEWWLRDSHQFFTNWNQDEGLQPQ